MPTITWIEPDGEKIVAQLADGDNLMQAAKDRGVSYIYGECGGCLSCATCHVYVDPTWLAQLEEPDDFEISMLDLAEAAQKPNSRLSCQLTASDKLDGLILYVPEP